MVFDELKRWSSSFDLLVNRLDIARGYKCVTVAIRTNGKMYNLYIDDDVVLSFRLYDIDGLQRAIDYMSAWCDCLWYVHNKDVHMTDARQVV